MGSESREGAAPRYPIRVLVVDDSALIRRMLRDGLSEDPEIEVIGTARDPYVARDMLVRLRPDVITLDVEMPRMDGVTFLQRFMPILPTPTVVLSALTQEGKQLTIDALMAGAVDVLAKPRGIVDDLPLMMEDLRRRVRAAAQVDRERLASHGATPATSVSVGAALEESTDKVIALGASTGGVEALARMLPAFPPSGPGIVLVEHLPPGFTGPFAKRLDSVSAMQVKEAEDGDRIRPGLALVAPAGDRHTLVKRSGGEYRIRLRPQRGESRHCPSVDVLFDSVAQAAGANAAAALLTGMGSDGAAGIHAIRRAGGRTFAQDEASCVVFGMPGAAWRRGAVERLLPLESIPRALLEALEKRGG